MAGFLDFLGGAAQSVANTVDRNQELKRMEEFQNRLRKQEMEDQIKKDKIRAQLERSNRAGTIQGSPILSPTGEAFGLRYDAEGGQANLERLGTLPGIAEETQREIDEAARKAQLDERRVGAMELRASRTGLGRGGSGPKPPTAAQVRAEENAAIAESAAARGLIYNTSSRTLTRPADPNDEDSKATIVTGEEREQIMREATAGKSQSNPVTITSEAEAASLPPGTYFRLNGRLGQVE